MENLILKADLALRTKFDATKVLYKKTFLVAKKKGINLLNTNEAIKLNGFVFKISYVKFTHKGKIYESIDLIPLVRLKK